MYSKIEPGRFLLGLAIVAIPALMLERSGEDTWAMRYSGLILLMLIVTHWRGIEALQRFLSAELNR